MKVFEDIKLKDGCMVGYLALPDSVKVAVEFDLEEEDAPEKSDFMELISDATAWAGGLSAERIAALKNEIAIELTDSAFQQSDYRPTERDYSDLQNELAVVRLYFFPEDVVVMVCEAKQEYPDMEINCQLDRSYRLEDISVEKKSR
jgi:hypothetical protein